MTKLIVAFRSLRLKTTKLTHRIVRLNYSTTNLGIRTRIASKDSPTFLHITLTSVATVQYKQHVSPCTCVFC